jgi:DNA-binding transcriptional ArsR family regulator
VPSWSFLSNHGRVLLCLAQDPGMRLRDIAAQVGITERTAYGIVSDLTKAGYVAKLKDGRRNRYKIQAHRPLPEPTARERTVGEVLALLADTDVGDTGVGDTGVGDTGVGDTGVGDSGVGNGRAEETGASASRLPAEASSG